MLQALLRMLFLELQYFFRGIRYLTFCIHLAAHHYYGHMAASYTYINFNELLWNYEFIITKIYFH